MIRMLLQRAAWLAMDRLVDVYERFHPHREVGE